MLSVPALRLLHVLRLRGTLTAAAAELHLSRSAASHQLASLQRAVGVALTEKVGRGLRLTEAGRQLAMHAQRVLREIEAAGAVVEHMRDTPAGTVQLGAIQTAAISIVPEVLVKLRQAYPLLRVRSRSLTTEEALLAVPSGQVDVAIVASYDTSPVRVPSGVMAVPLFRDPVRIALPSGHTLAQRSTPIPVVALETERWISGTPDSYFGRLVPVLCHRAGYSPEVEHHSDDYAVVASLVAAGQGVAIIPAAADLTRWPGITVAAIDADDAGRDIVALLRTGSADRPTITAVLEAIRRRSTAIGESCAPAPR